jgi:excisionase family DNA binding protein
MARASDEDRDGAPTESSREPVVRLMSAAGRLAKTVAETERLMQDSITLLANAKAPPRGRANERFVPLSEAARRTGRHPDLLRRWSAAGRIPAVRIGRTWCLAESDLDALPQLPKRTQRRQARGDR